ncbi:MAG: acyltransferase family protein [Acidimicrobiia bacterium]
MRLTEPVRGPGSGDGADTSVVGRAAEAIGPGATRFGYHPALDGIRALAVLGIIAYHDNYHWARGAFLGVDAFLVLSGFLITTLLVVEYRRTDRVGLVAFWGRRARRLVPALLLVLVFVALYTHHFVTPWERASIRDDGLASLFYVANWRFILDKQSYFTLFSAASPLRHMWSLAIEEQFYVIWPLIVFACLRIGRGSMKVLACVTGFGIVASVAAMAATYRSGDPSRAYYGTDTRAHVLLIGALVAMLLLSWRPSDRTRTIVMALGPIALAATLLEWNHFSDTDPAFYRGRSVLFAVVIAIVIIAAMNGGIVQRILALRPLPWIGRISYGLYLWHWPLTVWLVPSRVHVGPDVLNLIRLALTFSAAILSYYFIERPIRAGWARHPRPIAVVAPLGVMVALVAVLASAAGASPPPSYVLNIGDPVRCGQPQPAERRAAHRENKRRGRLALPHAARDVRVLLVGDSTACSLWPGLREVGRSAHVAVAQASVFGCGVASGEVTTTRGEQVAQHSERCPQLVDDALRKALPKTRPNVVVWMSIWEKSDLVVDGKTLVSGTPAGDRAMFARMDDALAQLTRGGARVVLVIGAAPAPNDAQGTNNTSNAIDDASYRRLASIDRRFAARHRDTVSVVDLASRICPGGPPCPELVRGERIRPDGRHFTPEAATRFSRLLLTKIVAHRS